jgi:ubiquinone/menaquinone biosynthesis C-methylase UbiE
MTDPAKYREEFWRDIKDSFVVDNINMGPKRKKLIAKIVKENNIKSVLELGCCSGGNLKAIREVNPDIKIVGFDINEKAIAYAKEVEKIDAEFVVGSIYDLSKFEDKSFDLVFTCAVLVHIPSEKIEDIIKNMKRMSRKFIFNIESNGKSRVMTVANDVPYAWWTDYVSIYKSLGLQPKISGIEKILPKTKIGVASHIISGGIDGSELKY